MPDDDTRVEDAYPLPWRFGETWTGTEITAANLRPVVRIKKGREGERIAEERLLAEWIVRAVNAANEEASNGIIKFQMGTVSISLGIFVK